MSPGKRRTVDNDSRKRFKSNGDSNGGYVVTEQTPRRNRRGNRPDFHVDVMDTYRRTVHGNNFEEGADFDKPNVTTDNGRLEISYGRLNACPNSHIQLTTELPRGRVGLTDGIGIEANGTVLSSNVALGPVDVGGSFLGGQVGASITNEHGVDLGWKCNGNLATAHVGPAQLNVGAGIDTGVQAGDWTVGGQFLGTGMSVGRTTRFTVFGSGITIKLW